MRWLLLVLLLVPACGDDSSGPDEVVNIAGSWNWAADVSNTELSLTCVASGAALLEQSGSQFSGVISNGSGTCTGPGGSAPFDPNGAIGGGTIEDDNVSFDDNFCEYTGIATGNPTNEIDGDVTCIFPIQGEDVVMTGTWEMNR